MTNEVYTDVDGSDKDHLKIIRSQNVAPLLEQNNFDRNNASNDWKGDWHRVASVPEVVVEDYCNKNKITFKEFMNNQDHIKRLLNNPDYAYFRTKVGRV